MGKLRLGFDIGGSTLKIAALRGREIRVEEVRLPENMIDSGDGGGIALPHAFAQFLKQTKKELRLPHGPAALVLPPSQVICRLVTMPQMTEEQLLMNLPYEFSDFIQGAADLYHCDYAVCAAGEGDGDGVPMMAAAAAKDTLAEYTRMFAQAGIKLKVVLPQEMALIQLIQSRKAGAEEFCFVDLGHRHTRITVVWRDRVQATRQIALGGRSIDLVIADELGVDAFLSNTYKLNDFQDVLDLPSVADVCDRIAVEILKVVNFYQFTYRTSNLGGVYLVGGGAALPLLRRSIENTVDLPLLDLADLLPECGGRAAAGIFAAGAVMRE